MGYFGAPHGKCLVTLMIAETVDPDQARPSSAARLSLAMLPGQSAALASEEGTSMQLTCGAGAETVAIKLTGERMTAFSGWPFSIRPSEVKRFRLLRSPISDVSRGSALLFGISP